MTREQEKELKQAIEELQEVYNWVAPIVRNRQDEWKADRLGLVISLSRELDKDTENP